MAYSSILKMEATVPPKRRLALNGLKSYIKVKSLYLINEAPHYDDVKGS
jgi:hypothetical protein